MNAARHGRQAMGVVRGRAVMGWESGCVLFAAAQPRVGSFVKTARRNGVNHHPLAQEFGPPATDPCGNAPGELGGAVAPDRAAGGAQAVYGNGLAFT